MTQDEIIRMAQESGVIGGFDDVHPSIERFAALVAAHERESFKVYVNQVVADREMAVHDAVLAEREACAKVCDFENHQLVGMGMENEAWAAKNCAEAIRARGEK